MIKAYHVAEDYSDWYGAHMLVYAESPGKAKSMALNNGTWDYDGYLNVKVRRIPRLDGIFTIPTIVEDNSELPDGVEFYSDEEPQEDYI